MYTDRLRKRCFFLVIVIQRHLGGGLRRRNGGKIRGRARRGGGVAFSWSVRGRVTDDGRTSLFFYETFISYQLYIYINGKFSPGSVSISSNTRKASFPTSDHTQPHSMRALIRAPSPSRRAVHRFIANSRSLAARCVSQACSSDWAAASFVDDENDPDKGPTRNG